MHASAIASTQVGVKPGHAVVSSLCGGLAPRGGLPMRPFWFRTRRSPAIRRALLTRLVSTWLIAAPLSLASRAAATPLVPAFIDPWTPHELFPVSSIYATSLFPLADIDGDGDLDAFASTPYPGPWTFWENTGSAQNPSFVSRGNQYDLFGSIGLALADIDGDGDLDLFQAAYYTGLHFSENFGTATDPFFLGSETNPFGITNVGDGALPSFVDIDGDGDLDLYLGDLQNTYLFTNSGTAHSPAFAAKIKNPFKVVGRPFATNPEFADIDADGDFDAFVGSTNGPVMFPNSGTATSPAFGSATSAPPGLNDVEDTPFLADIDADGDIDALAAVNARVLLFRNTGSAASAAFDGFTPNPFGVAGVASTNAYDPSSTCAFVDIDGDGDLDIFIGTGTGDIRFFQNAGTPSAPSFLPFQSLPFGLTPVTHGTPDFADIDGDGDVDAFIGRDDGKTVFFSNTGTRTSPAFAAPVVDPFGLIDIGANARPMMLDYDDDGDFDALVANTSTIYLFRNTGSATSPQFPLPTTLLQDSNGARPVFADMDGDGDADLIYSDLYIPGPGHGVGFIENTGTKASPSFAPAELNPFGLVPSLRRTMVTFADIDDDGDTDGFFVDTKGQVLYFRNAALTTVFTSRFESGTLDEWSSHEP